MWLSGSPLSPSSFGIQPLCSEHASCHDSAATTATMRVRDERDRAHEAAAEDDPVHHQRQAHAEHELDRDADHRDDHRVEHVLPPDRRGQDVAVVRQADELRGVREAQVGALQRQRDGVDDRVGRDRDHHDRGRSDQPDARRRSARARSLRCCRRLVVGAVGALGGGDGAHSRADEDRDSLISLRNVLTTVFGLMFEVGDRVFWIASVTSA